VSDVLERAGSLMHTLDKTISKNADEIGNVMKGLSLASNRLAAALEEIRKAAQETRDAVGGIRRATEKVLDAKRVAGVLDEAKGAIGDARQRLSKDEMGKVTRLLERLLTRTNALVERINALRFGTDEEAAKAMRELLQPATPPVDQMYEHFAKRLEWDTAVKQFKADNADLLQDQVGVEALAGLFLEASVELLP